ncbi:hypothetical protein BN8_03286 [Fibrisoma limi BUZ 3]|uniref:Uncharacterized protein n=1 Tax=Fibrisoma limi BUZ 3 TaxID=1185876 RepID=I2GJR7_9BACT|nr:hypothetical protein BN8_03286 [Fibrisoma limi BUZ 3]
MVCLAQAQAWAVYVNYQAKRKRYAVAAWPRR